MPRPLVRRVVTVGFISVAALASAVPAAGAAVDVNDANHRISFEESSFVALRSFTVVFNGASRQGADEYANSYATVAFMAGAQTPCPASYSIAADRAVETFYWTSESDEFLRGGGPFTVRGNVTLSTAGNYTVCGYFGDAGIRDTPDATKERFAPVGIAVSPESDGNSGSGSDSGSDGSGADNSGSNDNSSSSSSNKTISGKLNTRKNRRSIRASLSRRPATDNSSYKVRLTRSGRTYATGTVRGRTLSLKVRKRSGRYRSLRGRTYSLRSTGASNRLPTVKVKLS